MSVTAVSKRLSNLGEGPFWDNISQKLYYVDAFVGDICRLNPETGDTENVHLDGIVTVAIPSVENPGNLLVTRNKDVLLLEFETKKFTLLSTVDAHNPKSRFNDGKCDSKGRFWGGTLLEDQSSRGKLWMLDPLTLHFCAFVENISLSNGLTWSLDNKTLYYVDSAEKVIYSFDFDAENPKLGKKIILADFKKSEEYLNLGVPDGMTIDVEGKLWVACFGGGCVIRIDPENGRMLQKIMIPAKETTSCCFGGPNYDTLYVTSSFRGLNETEKIVEPQSGAVFAVTNLGTKGIPANYFDSK